MSSRSLCEKFCPGEIHSIASGMHPVNLIVDGVSQGETFLSSIADPGRKVEWTVDARSIISGSNPPLQFNDVKIGPGLILRKTTHSDFSLTVDPTWLMPGEFPMFFGVQISGRVDLGTDSWSWMGFTFNTSNNGSGTPEGGDATITNFVAMNEKFINGGASQMGHCECEFMATATPGRKIAPALALGQYNVIGPLASSKGNAKIAFSVVNGRPVNEIKLNGTISMLLITYKFR